MTLLCASTLRTVQLVDGIQSKPNENSAPLEVNVESGGTGGKLSPKEGKTSLSAEAVDVEEDEEVNELMEKRLGGTAEDKDKHPLRHHWTLWFLKPEKQKNVNWEKRLTPVASVEYVEDFFKCVEAILVSLQFVQ